MFSMHANLGIVAYALIRPPSQEMSIGPGIADELNSGVTAYWVEPGYCDVTLPGDPNLQEPMQEGQNPSPARDIVLITPIDCDPVTYAVSVPAVPNPGYVRRIQFMGGEGGVSVAFTIIILRSLISPPMDVNGNYLAPA